ncbi:alpha/beta-hydrolase [Tuber magnatum]|uniref:GPI inositol-deacylase n=1 Tax=Tuber magnatum TaxID=42249 RepID=A0A317SMQ4_9PEZI|nr:alpha/beta-hydrolase [Tuber magnatum]
MGIVTEMNLLLRAKIPQQIAKLQQLGSLCGATPTGRGCEQVKWAAAEIVSKDPQMHDLGGSLLGEFSTIWGRRETQESVRVLRVDKAKGGPKGFASGDPRTRQLGRTLSDEFAVIRKKYRTPTNPIVLCHGLLGFDELKLAGNCLPGIHYWKGVTEAFNAHNIGFILTSVPASGSVEVRAKALAECIQLNAKGRNVNLIGHSMGGIDARYMISKLKPLDFKVLSLTTVATPHRGSAFADYCLESIGERWIPRVYKALETIGMQTGAFSQLTAEYMINVFNKNVPDGESVRYFSYGAMTQPSLFSMLRTPHRIISENEGPNDGLVSVSSARWGVYRGTLVGPSHLDLIDWTNRLRWVVLGAAGRRDQFNAVAFYLGVADMLAGEGL